jgi:hypothetical protein
MRFTLPIMTNPPAGAVEFERNLLPCVKPLAHAEATTDLNPISVRGAGIAIPHPEKVQDGKRGVNMRTSGFAGEDAYFYTPGASEVFGMGVADGVYMWKKHGVDSGVFSRTLMDTAHHLVEAGYSDVLRIAEICQRKVDTEGIYGSSTFCLLVVDRKSARLHTACLGDSGFMVLGATPEQPEVCLPLAEASSTVPLDAHSEALTLGSYLETAARDWLVSVCLDYQRRRR